MFSTLVTRPLNGFNLENSAMSILEEWHELVRSRSTQHKAAKTRLLIRGLKVLACIISGSNAIPPLPRVNHRLASIHPRRIEKMALLPIHCMPRFHSLRAFCGGPGSELPAARLVLLPFGNTHNNSLQCLFQGPSIDPHHNGLVEVGFDRLRACLYKPSRMKPPLKTHWSAKSKQYHPTFQHLWHGL